MKRSVAWGAGIVAVAAAVWFHERRAVFVETEIVARGDVPLLVTGEGSILAGKSTEISAGTMGRVDKILVREGDLVNRGQLLVRLDPLAFRSQMESAEKSLRQAIAESESSLTALGRAREKTARAGALEGEKMASSDYLRAARADEQAAQSAHDAALKSVAEARGRVDAARDELVRAQVLAPIEGRVTDVRARVGETVADGHGPVLLSIADPGAWDAEVLVDEGAGAGIAPGQRATVRIAPATRKPIAGTVARLEKRRDGRVAVRIALRSPGEALAPGLRADAAIATAGRTDVAIVPTRSLVERGSSPEGAPAFSVFLLERGRAKEQRVSVGLRSAGRAEIRAGLRGGEKIVVAPLTVLQRLKDGDRVASNSGGVSRWL